jgi:hypothetical protein
MHPVQVLSEAHNRVLMVEALDKEDHNPVILVPVPRVVDLDLVQPQQSHRTHSDLALAMIQLLIL